MTTQIRECPFCGEQPTLDEIPAHTHKFATFMPDHPGSWVVECNCGCGLINDTAERVVERWNTRAVAPEVAALAKAADDMWDAITFGNVHKVSNLAGPLRHALNAYSAALALAGGGGDG